MAQRHARGMRMLARRYGLVAGGGAAIACVALILVLGIIGAAGARNRTSFSMSTNEEVVSQREDRKEEAAEPEPRSSTVVVHVDGAVGSPGVYVLEGESLRINDAITMAGGLLEDADTSCVNLAASLEDGQKVHIPVLGEVSAPNTTELQQPTGGGRVNVNLADEGQLQDLPGVGEATARAIVEDREQNGPFSSPEDLMRVSGIGEKKFEKMRDMVDV